WNRDLSEHMQARGFFQRRTPAWCVDHHPSGSWPGTNTRWFWPLRDMELQLRRNDLPPVDAGDAIGERLRGWTPGREDGERMASARRVMERNGQGAASGSEQDGKQEGDLHGNQSLVWTVESTGPVPRFWRRRPVVHDVVRRNRRAVRACAYSLD